MHHFSVMRTAEFILSNLEAVTDLFITGLSMQETDDLTGI